MSRGKIVGDGAGQYKIGDVLGNGAFSTVYQCTRLIDGEIFAVKVISKNAMRRDSQMEDALCREINSMEVIRRSPFITNMIEKLVSPRNYYIVMDLAVGGPLMHVIQQSHQGLHPNRARLYFRQLLMGMTAMHDSNVVHRDIKPENLLLDATKTVLKISDFGFACFSDPTRLLNRRCGTLRFTAPEFSRNDEPYLGRAVDLWAAGVTLYVMLFNMYPFGKRGDSDAVVMERIQKQDVRFPRKISGSLEHLIRVMLRKDPRKRWSLEKVKSHAWVMGIDEFTISIPRRKVSMTSAPAHNPNGDSTIHPRPPPIGVPANLGASLGSGDSPPLFGSPSFNSNSFFLYNNGGGGAGSPPALGATPADEDRFFCIKSSLLDHHEEASADETESEDGDYIAGGMHRRVRSCPVLPTVFFGGNPFDYASLSTSAAGTAVGSPVGLPARQVSEHGETVGVPTTPGSPTDAISDRAVPFPSLGVESTKDSVGRMRMATLLRQERKAQLYKAMRLSDMHSVSPSTASPAAGVLGAVTGLSQSSGIGFGVEGTSSAAMSYLTESQKREAFYTDLPTRRHPVTASNVQRWPSSHQRTQRTMSGSTSTVTPPLNTTAGDASLVDAGWMSSSKTSLPKHTKHERGFSFGGSSTTTPPRMTPMDGSGKKDSSISPASSNGTKPNDDAARTNRSPAESAFAKSNVVVNGGGSAATSSLSSARRRRIEVREPLYRRLGFVHVRILFNFCFFWLTLLTVGALKVLLDVDARKLALPQTVKDFLERVLAPPFEEEVDSLGTGGGETPMSARGVAPHGLPRSTGVSAAGSSGSQYIGPVPPNLRRRVAPVAAPAASASSFEILTTHARAPAHTPETVAMHNGSPIKGASGGRPPFPGPSMPVNSCIKASSRVPPNIAHDVNDDDDSVASNATTSNSHAARSGSAASSPDKKRVTVHDPQPVVKEVPPQLPDFLPVHEQVDGEEEPIKAPFSYIGADAPPAMCSTLPGPSVAASHVLDFLHVVEDPSALSTEEAAGSEDDDRVFELRAIDREQGMRAVASHHENIDDLLDCLGDDDEDNDIDAGATGTSLCAS